MATNAICMVKVIRLQKPLPKATLTVTGEAPFAIAAIATTTTAIATKIKASGNQRSAHAVKPIAIRTSAPSWVVEPPEGAAVTVVAMMRSPTNSCAGSFRAGGWAGVGSSGLDLDQRALLHGAKFGTELSASHANACRACRLFFWLQGEGKTSLERMLFVSDGQARHFGRPP